MIKEKRMPVPYSAASSAFDESRRRRGLDAETIQTLLDLLNPLHGSLDKQTYDEKLHEHFDAPKDREYEVTVTAQQERDLTQAVLILEDRLRQARASEEVICPTCRGERRDENGQLCCRCNGTAQIRRSQVRPGEIAPFEPLTRD
jgi:DnaJ-class molecular chaperone